jgi:hypothetical protein
MDAAAAAYVGRFLPAAEAFCAAANKMENGRRGKHRGISSAREFRMFDSNDLFGGLACVTAGNASAAARSLLDYYLVSRTIDISF